MQVKYCCLLTELVRHRANVQVNRDTDCFHESCLSLTILRGINTERKRDRCFVFVCSYRPLRHYFLQFTTYFFLTATPVRPKQGRCRVAVACTIGDHGRTSCERVRIPSTAWSQNEYPLRVNLLTLGVFLGVKQAHYCYKRSQIPNDYRYFNDEVKHEFQR